MSGNPIEITTSGSSSIFTRSDCAPDRNVGKLAALGLYLILVHAYVFVLSQFDGILDCVTVAPDSWSHYTLILLQSLAQKHYSYTLPVWPLTGAFAWVLLQRNRSQLSNIQLPPKQDSTG